MPTFADLTQSQIRELLLFGMPYGQLPAEMRLGVIRDALESQGMSAKAKVTPETASLIRNLAAQGLGLGGIESFLSDIQAREELLRKKDERR